MWRSCVWKCVLLVYRALMGMVSSHSPDLGKEPRTEWWRPCRQCTQR